MPLGRFAAYFFLLVTVCLVAFPRAVGAPPPAVVSAPDTMPPTCSETPDGGMDCAPPDPSLWQPRHRTPPALRRRLEAGESAPLPDTLPADKERDHPPFLS